MSKLRRLCKKQRMTPWGPVPVKGKPVPPDEAEKIKAAMKEAIDFVNKTYAPGPTDIWEYNTETGVFINHSR